MAFGFGVPGGGGLNTSQLKQLLEIDTEAIEFHAIAKDAKVQLMSAWPSSQLPPPTSSLLAIAPRQGLLAAGGPTAVVIASTEAVRNAFSNDASGDIKPFTPQLTLDLGIRISQVAFSSDENFLTISAEQGGGLAVYEVDSLLKGNTNTSFELSTAQVSVRALVPNPGVEMAALFAIVNNNGQLMIADMKARQVSNPIKEGVSCVAWSTKGKQLVAGLGDGSALQMTPTGEVVKQIAKPPGVENNRHLSAVVWLDNFTFLVIHTASDASDPTSTFHIVITDKADNCEYQKLPEAIGTFGLERYPPSIFVQRLKDFPPNLKEVLILASTASEDVGLITKSTKPLNSSADASQITETFTTTTMTNDSRRAALPMADDMTNSSPIGMVLDLSSKTLVRKPLPSDEMDESSTPLPALLILNNVGVLAGWWFAYAESIKTGTCYPGLVHATQSSTPQQATGGTFGASKGSAFGGGAIKPATTGFGFSTTPAPTTSAFGQTSTLGSSQPAFGAPSMPNSSKLAFGSPSSIGSNAPAFGAPSTIGAGNSGGTVFGAASGIGARASPWGGASSQTGGSVFGKSSFGNVASPWAAAGSGNTNTGNTGSIFGQNSGSAPQNPVFGGPSQSATGLGNQAATTGGFASFANTGGFASAKGPSVFTSQTPSNNFSSNTESSSLFGSVPAANKSSTLFGANSSGFSLGSAWKNDQPGKPISDAKSSGGSSLFGSDFGKILGDASERPQQARSEERDMEDEMTETVTTPNQTVDRPATHESTTPIETPAPANFPTIPPVGSGLFGTQAQQKPTPAAVQSSKPAFSFSTTPSSKPTSASDNPLPPDTTSKTTFTPATSSDASTDSATKPSSNNALPLSSPSDGSTKQPPSVSSEPPTMKTTTPAKPAKSIVPTVLSNTVGSSPNIFAAKTKSDEVAGAPTSSSSMFSPSKSASTPVKASSKTPKSPSSSQKGRNESITTTEDGEGEDAEDEEEYEDYEEGEFDEEDEEAEEDNEHEDDDEDEGSGIDVGDEIGSGTSFNPSAKTSFEQQGSGLTDASWANIRPPTSQHRRDILESVRFPPAQPDNERSPSPERRLAAGFLRSEGSRSISAPNITANSRIAPHATRQAENTSLAFEQKRRAEKARRSNIAAQQQAQEEQSLEDDQDEAVRQLLTSDVEPSRVLEPFLAHQDYTAYISKTGVPGQIERIYRDINSMIDTVGLNSRSIQAFVMGHEDVSETGREPEDLRTAKNWILGEIGELEKVQQELEATLHDARLRQVPEKMATLGALQGKIKGLLRQKKDIKAITISQFESAAENEQHRNLELSFEQRTQRQALRTKWKEFQDQLSETESAISMLKSKLTTLAAGSRNGTSGRVPTVEAVEKTIRKMTKMAEEKSGDVDLLEAQMRKLDMHPGTPSTSRHGSAFMTPQSSIYNPRTSLRSEAMSGASPLRNTMYASTNGLDRSLNSALLSSVYGPPQHKNLEEYTDEDIQPFARRAQRSKIVMGHLRDALVGKNGEKKVDIVQLVDSDST